MSNAIENDKKLVLENQYVKFRLESGKMTKIIKCDPKNKRCLEISKTLTNKIEPDVRYNFCVV